MVDKPLYSMDAKIRRRWLRALRSGKYKQGREALKNDRGGFCCLGVLCDIARKDGVGGWEHKFGSWEFLDRTGQLPAAVVRWANLRPLASAMDYERGFLPNARCQDPIIHIDKFGDVHRASVVNDDGRRFKTIAKMVETAIKGV